MPPATKKLTPMMERYLEVKREHPGSILLFRMGDFYELFYEDAEIAARVLGLTLTSRDKGTANPIPMAGFPYHALQNYLQKLIQSGHRAAICDQVEDPKQAKGLVRREVTQIITPGTLTDENLLDPRRNNFLAAIALDKQVAGLSWLDVSTGRFFVTEVESEFLNDELARLQPAECLVCESEHDRDELTGLRESEIPITKRAPWCFVAEECHRLLLEHFEVQTLEGFDLDSDQNSLGIVAAGALLEYVHETQKRAIPHILRLEPYRRGNSLLIDETTRRSLELTQKMRDGSRNQTLLSVIDETVSPMGARLLSEWLSNPLMEIPRIVKRHEAVEELVQNTVLAREIRDELKQTYDLQRLTGRIATGRANPRDLVFLARTLAVLPKVKAKLSERSSALLNELEANIDLCEDVRSDIESQIVDEPPLLLTDGGVIRDGINEQLDEYRELARGGKQWLAKYQTEESERTGITNLKIGFNRVFGYYLEVTAAHKDKVPEEYIRKQTLKNQERYITPQLKEYEDKVLRAEERAVDLEQQMFQAVRDRVAEEINRLQQDADILAQIDVLAALSVVAVQQGYCRPEMCEEPILDIREGRHPVLDKIQPSGEFVPNDTRLGGSTGLIQLITGPNMAGKSTYIRQAALITILAQMGSFVPASEARIGIADRVFARVGASDELGKGQSTFMVEMTETARILNSATPQSLVILDEIGRGTSTYDGISLAWAVTEYLHDVCHSRTLFATHYHELTELPERLKETSNWNVAVREEEEQIIFLHKIVEGSADKSYGIHVARLAGIPPQVVQRSQVILDTLEADHVGGQNKQKIPARPTRQAARQQMSLFESEPHPLLNKIKELDLDGMTPRAALDELYRLRKELGE
ncbi:DNA mismatch repair protein MutS [Polystyrenella longa]|uniref:DNA mismatch repair protein MutS n=1 Tax=Polystyrenella longa TaxID=2528007 RepID=A0A518CHB5_9PLAN|nr:DNA mismatch repair protein MutS [Polystyrenella longa]QDU78564.1 DNA mismatch repair protein MutS [Polystyrenella longa]